MDGVKRHRSLVAVGALIAFTAIALLALEVTARPGLTGASGHTPTGLSTLIAVVFLIAGAPVAARRPGHPIGRIFLGTAFGWAAVGVLNQLVERAGASGGPYPPALVLLAWVLQWSWVPLVIPGIVLVPQFFPDGKLLSPRWRFLPLLTWSGIALLIAGAGTGDYEVLPGVRNPFMADAPRTGVASDQSAIATNLISRLAFGIILLAVGLTIVTLVIRTRRGTPTERQQLRDLLAAAVIWPIGVVPSLWWYARDNSFVFQLIGLLGLLALPVAIALAILRYRLYDIDVVINHAIVYASLTAVLAGSFVAAQFLFQRTFVAATGTNSDMAVVLALFVIATVFNPIKTRLQTAVDRRFKVASPAHRPSTAAPQSSPESIPALLTDLAGLRDRGVITPQQFEEKRAELLARL